MKNPYLKSSSSSSKPSKKKLKASSVATTTTTTLSLLPDSFPGFMAVHPIRIPNNSSNCNCNSDSSSSSSSISSSSDITSLVWILYTRKGIESQRGAILKGTDDTNAAWQSFVAACASLGSTGYRVAHNMTEIEDWIQTRCCKHTATANSYYATWNSIRNYSLQSKDFCCTVDTEAYQALSLCELHRKIVQHKHNNKYDNSSSSNNCSSNNTSNNNIDTIRYEKSVQHASVAAELVGECFAWFVHYHVKSLTFGRGIPKTEQCFRNISDWDRIDEEGGEVSASFSSSRMIRMPSSISDDSSTSATCNPNIDDDHHNKVQYVVLDLETHDWKPGMGRIRRWNVIGKIVEMAWQVFDIHGTILESKCFLLRPQTNNGEVYYAHISNKASRCHGITTRCAQDLGSDAGTVLTKFVNILRQIPSGGFVVAHNMYHEDAIMYTNLLQEEDRKLWESVPKCCTMRKDLLQLLPTAEGDHSCWKNKRGATTWWKLPDLYHAIEKIVVPCSSSQQAPKRAILLRHHQALSDVEMTWTIFWYYVCENERRRLPSRMNFLWSHDDPKNV